MAYLEYFSDSLIALNQELVHHPDVRALLSLTGDWTQRLGEIAAYFGIIVDGVYTQSDIDHLADGLVRKLQEKRAIILILH